MRLQRGTPVAGLDPEEARSLARACHRRGWHTADYIAYKAKVPERSVGRKLKQLVDAGFLEVRRTKDGMEWHTTLDGGALTMASFLKPIPRAKADALLAGVLDRVSAYNADETKPQRILSVRVFGSYLDEAAVEVGDLDLALTWERRPDIDAVKYARSSGRRFATFTDMLNWGEVERTSVIKNRSPYIHVTTEDISKFTEVWRVVFGAYDPIDLEANWAERQRKALSDD